MTTVVSTTHDRERALATAKRLNKTVGPNYTHKVRKDGRHGYAVIRVAK